MRIALVHDDLVQWGGAERVLVGLSKIFPDAPIYTSVYDEQNKLLAEKLSGKKIITSFMQKIPGWKNIYKLLLPLYPIAFEQFDFTDFDLVISNTTRFARCVTTKPHTKHICYCHTPPRFLYGYGEEKRTGWYFNKLRDWDYIWSKRVDYWVAGSQNAGRRITDIYRTKSKVIYPFVNLDSFAGIESFAGGYLLVISRLNKYKRVDLAIEVAKKRQIPLKIVGVGREMNNLQNQADHQVEFLGRVDEKLLKILIAGCWALLVCGEEDFGLTPLEAQVLGKPVIALKKGGVLETVIDGKSGYFFEEAIASSLSQALDKLEKYGYNQEIAKKNTEQFSFLNFKKNWLDLIRNAV